jgi:hypothetical protein
MIRDMCGDTRSKMDNAELVRRFLRAQNLEQIGRVDEAVELYEAVVDERFDSSGPYDRLIAIYADRAGHRDVVRIAQAALEQVQTHSDKRAWYERMRADAERAAARVPPAAPKRSR